MLVPYIVSGLFVLAVVILCFVRPKVGRIFLGFFYLAMALGVNGAFVLAAPHFYVQYGSEALLPVYRVFATRVIAWNPVLFGLLLMVFETAMGVCILSRGRYVKIGLIGTIFFLCAILPVSLLQVPWLGLVIGQGYLLNHRFDDSLIALLRRNKRKVTRAR